MPPRSRREDPRRRGGEVPMSAPRPALLSAPRSPAVRDIGPHRWVTGRARRKAAHAEVVSDTSRRVRPRTTAIGRDDNEPSAVHRRADADRRVSATRVGPPSCKEGGRGWSGQRIQRPAGSRHPVLLGAANQSGALSFRAYWVRRCIRPRWISTGAITAVRTGCADGVDGPRPARRGRWGRR